MARPAVQWFVRDDTRSLFDQRGLTGLDKIFDIQASTTLSKRGLPAWRARRKLELIDDSGQLRVFYVKTYDHPPMKEQARRWGSLNFRRGTAWREWQWSNRLNELGIPAVEAVAFGQSMVGMVELRSALVTRAVSGRSLESLANSNPASLARSCLMQLAELVARLHRTGFIHRDLYLCHVFVEQQGALRLIDLQRMIAPWWGLRRWWIKDLAALNYSAPSGFAGKTGRLRFLLRYLGKSRLDPQDRRFVRAILARTRRMAKHDEGKGRLQPWQRGWLIDAVFV